MDDIFYLVVFYGGLIFIGWIFSEIGKWNNERKRKIRDEVAKEMLPKTDVNQELLNEYQEKLKKIGYDENQKYSWLSNHYTDKKSYRGLLGKCPDCKEGYLRVIDGKYGKFLGCSGYPKCRYTKNLNRAKTEYKEKSKKAFFKLFNLAYQT